MLHASDALGDDAENSQDDDLWSATFPLTQQPFQNQFHECRGWLRGSTDRTCKDKDLKCRGSDCNDFEIHFNRSEDGIDDAVPEEWVDAADYLFQALHYFFVESADPLPSGDPLPYSWPGGAQYPHFQFWRLVF